MPSSSRLHALLLAALPPLASALRVTSGSPCSRHCGNVLDNTVSSDMTCDEKSYSSTSAGTVFQNCVSCELTSPYTNNKQTDQQWMLYNVRYATSYCLFGVPDNPNVGSSPCLTSTACEPLKRAITFNELSPNGTAYDYCALWRPEQILKCGTCLRAGGNFYISNFIKVLDVACAQQPVAGRTISIEGDPFSRFEVNATDPSPIPSLSPDYFKEDFPLTAKVGIAIGGFAFLLVILGCCVVWNGKRRRRAFLRRLEARTAAGQAGWPATGVRREMHETPTSQKPLRAWDGTPTSQRPLRAWDDSPMTATSEKPLPRYFSPYSSQYNSPVSAVEGPSMPWPPPEIQPQEPRHQHEIGLALGGDGDSDHWDSTGAKGKAKLESYEMHEVDSKDSGSGRLPSEPEPPVLQHPGHGRNGHSPPRVYGLTDEDARRGLAF